MGPVCDLLTPAIILIIVFRNKANVEITKNIAYFIFPPFFAK